MLDLAADFKHLDSLPSDERLRALQGIIPLDVIQEVLEETGHAKRHCPLLPHWLVLYLVIGLGLFAKDSHVQIFKYFQRFRRGKTPSRGAIGEARKGLGVAPVIRLANKVVRLLAKPDTPHAFHRDLRLTALDAFVVNLQDTPDLARIFGKPKSGRAEGAFPQARVLALCETGTHVIYKHLIKPIHVGEVTMAHYLLRWLEEGMLLLWDRNFLSYKTLQMVKAKKAHLLARVKSNFVFKPTKVLSDGSFLAKMYRNSYDREHDRNGIEVRIIEYTLDDPSRDKEGETHRLLTTLLDEKLDPAEDLVVLYHERWEEELAIDEVKTHQLERPVLRSKTAMGVVQELEGLLLAHFAVRKLMFEAAEQVNLPPRRLSFTATLKILRCRLPEVPKDPKDEAGRQRWWEDLLAEVGEAVIEPRRDRINPRVIKQKMSKWPKKRPHHRQHPQPKKPFRDTVRVT